MAALLFKTTDLPQLRRDETVYDALRRGVNTLHDDRMIVADRRASWTSFATIQHVESWGMQIGGVNTPTTRRNAITYIFLHCLEHFIQVE